MIAGSAQTLLASLGPKIIAQATGPSTETCPISIDKKRATTRQSLGAGIEDLPEALVELADSAELQDGDVDAAAEKFAKAAADSAGFHTPGESSCYIRALHGQLRH